MTKVRLEIITADLGLNRIVAHFFPDLFACASTKCFTIYTMVLPQITMIQIDLLNQWRDRHVIVDWCYQKEQASDEV